MNDEITVTPKDLGNGKMALQFVYGRQYYEHEAEQKEILDFFFGLDFLESTKLIQDDKIIITIETTKGKALDFFNQVSKVPGCEDYQKRLGIYFTNDN